jgi:hypothetical protein
MNPPSTLLPPPVTAPLAELACQDEDIAVTELLTLSVLFGRDDDILSREQARNLSSAYDLSTVL